MMMNYDGGRWWHSRSQGRTGASRAWSAPRKRMNPWEFEFPFPGSLISTFLVPTNVLINCFWRNEIYYADALMLRV